MKDEKIIIRQIADPRPAPDPDYPSGIVIVQDMTREEFLERYPNSNLEWIEVRG